MAREENFGPTRRDAGQGQEKRRGREGSRESPPISLIRHLRELGKREGEALLRWEVVALVVCELFMCVQMFSVKWESGDVNECNLGE